MFWVLVRAKRPVIHLYCHNRHIKRLPASRCHYMEKRGSQSGLDHKRKPGSELNGKMRTLSSEHIGIKQCRAEVPLKKDPARFKLCRCPDQKAKSAAAPPRN